MARPRKFKRYSCPLKANIVTKAAGMAVTGEHCKNNCSNYRKNTCSRFKR